MANLYTYFDNGSWEGYGSQVEYSYPSYNDGGTKYVYTLQRSNEQGATGSYSGKITFLYLYNQSTITGFNFALPLRNLSNSNGAKRPFALVTGKVYEIRAKVFVPSTNPIGTDDLPIVIGPGASSNQQLNMEYTTVGNAKDNWVEISFRWQESSSNSSKPVFLFLVDSLTEELVGGFMPSPQGTLNLNGVMYIDDIILEEITTCDIQLTGFGYSKTDESAADANNGSITVNATSSYILSYSLDNTNFQQSNGFPGLPPGYYTVYIRDTNPEGCTASVDVTIYKYNQQPPPDPPQEGALTIDLTPLNENNFITWFSANGLTNFIGETYINCCSELPNPYRQCSQSIKHAPVVVSLETFSFYINFKESYSDPDFSGYRLALVGDEGIVQDNIGTLVADYTNDGLTEFNIYCSEVIVNSGIPVGYYRLAIYRIADNSIVMVSNEIQLMTVSEAKHKTVMLNYRNSFDFYKYYYTHISDFLNKIRLRMYALEENPDGELAQYRAASTGRLRNVSYELDRYVVFETYYFDDLAHRAMMVWQAHDFILINGKFYLPKSLYKVEWNQKRLLNKGKIEMYEQDFSTINRYGKLDNLTIIGSEDPLLLGDGGSFIKL